LVQLVPVQVGVMARVLARRPHVMSTVPFECEPLDGTAWQSVQTIATRIVPATRCAWCAPTPRTVVAVPPLTATGGAGRIATLVRVASPWLDVQLPPLDWTVPSRCVAVTAVLDVDVAGWQPPQFVDEVCAAPLRVVAGGLPWHEVQVTVASFVPFRCSVGEMVVPVKPVWQFAQVAWLGPASGSAG
jgi:hypothetical protein